MDPAIAGAVASGSAPCNGTETADKAFNGTVNGGTGDKWCSTTGPLWLQADLARHAPSPQHRAARRRWREPATMNTRDFTSRSPPTHHVDDRAAVTGNTAAVRPTSSRPITARYVRLNITTPTQTPTGRAHLRVRDLRQCERALAVPPPLRRDLFLHR